MERNTVCCEKCNLTYGCRHFVAMINAEENCQILLEKLEAAQLKESERREELIRVTNMLNTAVPHGPADPDDPCPADCRRCALEKRYPKKPKDKPECDCLIPTLEGAGQHSPTCAVFKKRV